MTFYKKRIENNIIFFFIFFFLFISLSLKSHEIKPSIADFSINESSLTFEIRLNAELILSGIDASDIQNTDNSNLSYKYDDLRKLPDNDLKDNIMSNWNNISQNIYIKLDGDVQKLNLLSIEIINQRNYEVTRDTIINFHIPLDKKNTSFSFSMSKKFGSIILREQNLYKNVDQLYTNYLNSGDASDLINLNHTVALTKINSFIKYLFLGIEHIIPKGLDHMLFIIGLFLFSNLIRPLLLQVTMFTIAHTITLVIASLSLINVNASIVEPLIALSIVYIGVENIFKKYSNTKIRYYVIFLFGLLHGLGFALVLKDVGLDYSNLLMNLVSFNIGVEIAQIFILFLLYLTIGLFFSKKKYYKIIFQIPLSLFISLIAIYWFVERII
ncbi:MAG: HupE/UreJ family protein [Pelagibacteraceae bacterium]|nr:HupE/UreJ family protein [Pelagibacteraceae bacterium]